MPPEPFPIVKPDTFSVFPLATFLSAIVPTPVSDKFSPPCKPPIDKSLDKEFKEPSYCLVPVIDNVALLMVNKCVPPTNL